MIKDIYNMIQNLEKFSGNRLKSLFISTLKDSWEFRTLTILAYNQTKYNIVKLPAPIFDEPAIGAYLDIVDTLTKIANSLVSQVDAKEALILYTRDKISHNIVSRILKKKLVKGIGNTIVHELLPELKLPKPMKCIDNIEKFLVYGESKYKDKHIFASHKLDGIRVAIEITPKEEITYYSSSWKPIPNFSYFNDWVRYLHDAIKGYLDRGDSIYLDGEMMSIHGRDHLMSQFRAKNPTELNALYFNIFDIYNTDLKQKDFYYRYTQLSQIKGTLYRDLEKFNRPNDDSDANLYIRLPKKIKFVEHNLISNNVQSINSFYASSIQAGYEGSVFKHPLSTYQHKRSQDWLKVKPIETLDLPVIKSVLGAGKYKHMCGSLIVNYNGVEVGVGSGLSDAQRSEFMQNPPKIIEVAYQEISKDGSLLCPRFIRTREDKE